MSNFSLVVDTNIVIDWLDGEPLALDLFEQYRDRAISRITFAEVLVGYKDDETREVVSELLKSCMEIVDTNEEDAIIAVKARIDSNMGLLDAFIYATALSRGAIVVTRNPKDFVRKGLDKEHIFIPYHTMDLRLAASPFDDAEITIMQGNKVIEHDGPNL
ncbi:MAG: PIN domain-containing protein [Pseudomonadota bacterium]